MQILNLTGRGFSGRTSREALLASLKEFFGKAIVQTLSDAFLAAPLFNAVFALGT